MALKVLVLLCVLPLALSTSKNIKVINFYEDAVVKYEPTWESLDKRPLPAWYDDVKFGIFLHWGVYSVPAFGSEWFWSNWEGLDPKIIAFMVKNYPIGFTYQQFAADFKAEFFNATQWAELFYESGAKYIVLTSKHHEGFTLWPSSRAFSWNAKDVGPHKDLVLELSREIRKKQGMHFGVYYSLYEWYNPMYMQDKKNMFKSDDYVKDKMLPELHELINTYRPEVLWTDGDWEAKDVYWQSTDFLAWLYNESPVKDTVVANDRWGSDIPCHHGGFYTCTDRYNPGKLQEHKWENCMTVDKKSWGFRRNAEITDYMTLHELITQLVSTVSCGGNLLMNVGPTKEGIIAPIFQERLKGMGEWLKINGDAIYKTKPWDHQNDTINSDVWYTAPKIQTKRPGRRSESVNTIYAVTLKWPESNLLTIGALSGKLKAETSEIFLLNDPQIKLKWTQKDQKVLINFPDLSTVKSKEAWTLKITYK